MIRPAFVTPESRGGPIALRGRILSFIVCALIGPALAGLIFGFVSLGFRSIFNPSELTPHSLIDPLAAAMLAAVFGMPTALITGVVTIAWAWDARTVPLMLVIKSFVLGLFAFYFLLFWRDFFTKPLEFITSFIGLFVMMGLPGLPSAAICWRITKRWHSPETNA